MKTNWLTGLDADKKKDLTAQFNASVLLRERLSKLCINLTNAQRNKSLTLTNYDEPNWALKQADLIGYERAMKDIVNLLK